MSIFNKTPKAKLTVQDLLDKEKAKTRRILTTVAIAVALVAGFIAGQFTMRNEVSNIQANAISTYISKTTSK